MVAGLLVSVAGDLASLADAIRGENEGEGRGSDISARAAPHQQRECVGRLLAFLAAIGTEAAGVSTLAATYFSGVVPYWRRRVKVRARRVPVPIRACPPR